MLLRDPSAPTVTRLRAGLVLDSYGDATESWDAPTRFVLAGAVVQDVSVVEEDSTSRRVLRGERTLYVPGPAALTADDRVEVGSEVWQVDGRPEIRRGLASSVYTTARLTHVTIG